MLTEDDVRRVVREELAAVKLACGGVVNITQKYVVGEQVTDQTVSRIAFEAQREAIAAMQERQRRRVP